MKLQYHKQFQKQLFRLSPKQQSTVKDKLILFQNDQYHPSLNNHLLKGKYLGYRSINITGDIRAIFMQHTKDHLEFVYIGKHAQLYD